MNRCKELELLLDGYVDGEASESERREVESHLEGCEDCRRVVERTRSLLAATADLDREIPPDEDLWLGIRAEVERAGAAQSSGASWGGGSMRWIGMAASLLVVMLAGWAALSLRDGGSVPAPVGGPPPAAQPASLEDGSSIDDSVRDYVEAAEVLMASIRERESQLSPETLAVLEKNLEIIDQAIQEVRSVLAEDPANRGNTMMLQAMHQQKVDLLRRVSRLSS